MGAVRTRRNRKIKNIVSRVVGQNSKDDRGYLEEC
jgi:hypothetical protein